MDNATKRIEFIDLLKVIGLIGIMTAHVESPEWALMARAFDVQLMVLISALLAKNSYERRLSKGGSAGLYIIQRVLRLAVPTWIFLTFYFCIFAFFKGEHDLTYYLSSYLFSLYGIAYVWIILIYIYAALVIPIYHKVGTGPAVTVSIAVIYVIYELMFRFGVLTDSKLFVNTFYYFIPYAALSFIGYCLPSMTKKTKCIITAASALVFTACALYVRFSTGRFERVSIATFPPRAYYLSYGIFIAFVLYLIFENFDLKIYRCSPIVFISKNSLWIYLWHIFTLAVFNKTFLFDFWYLELLAVFVSAVFITYIQTIVVSFLKKKTSLKILNYL